MRWNMYPTINMKATGTRLRQIMNQKRITVKDVQQYLGLSSVRGRMAGGIRRKGIVATRYVS